VSQEKVVEMAQIIRLRHNRFAKEAPSGGEALPASLRNCASGFVSLGNEVFPWVRQLESCLGNLDVVANALGGQPQAALRKEVELFRANLSLAIAELNQTLQELTVLNLRPRLGAAEDLSNEKNCPHTAGNTQA
jgi:hypothetical protein